MSLFHRFRKDQSGAVAVEFVLIAPMFFALLFGILCLGYFMGLSHSVHQLAAGAARASVAGLDLAERQGLAELYLSQAGTRYPLLDPAALTPAVAMATGEAPGITVTVAYAVDGSVLDLAGGFLGLTLTNIEGSAHVAY